MSYSYNIGDNQTPRPSSKIQTPETPNTEASDYLSGVIHQVGRGLSPEHKNKAESGTLGERLAPHINSLKKLAGGVITVCTLPSTIFVGFLGGAIGGLVGVGAALHHSLNKSKKPSDEKEDWVNLSEEEDSSSSASRSSASSYSEEDPYDPMTDYSVTGFDSAFPEPKQSFFSKYADLIKSCIAEGIVKGSILGSLGGLAFVASSNPERSVEDTVKDWTDTVEGKLSRNDDKKSNESFTPTQDTLWPHQTYIKDFSPSRVFYDKDGNVIGTRGDENTGLSEIVYDDDGNVIGIRNDEGPPPYYRDDESYKNGFRYPYDDPEKT